MLTITNGQIQQAETDLANELQGVLGTSSPHQPKLQTRAHQLIEQQPALK
jgi:hypothetical protein